MPDMPLYTPVLDTIAAALKKLDDITTERRAETYLAVQCALTALATLVLDPNIRVALAACHLETLEQVEDAYVGLGGTLPGPCDTPDDARMTPDTLLKHLREEVLRARERYEAAARGPMSELIEAVTRLREAEATLAGALDGLAAAGVPVQENARNS